MSHQDRIIIDDYVFKYQDSENITYIHSLPAEHADVRGGLALSENMLLTCHTHKARMILWKWNDQQNQYLKFRIGNMLSGSMYKDYEGRLLRRYPEIFDCINVIFVVVQKRILYKVELNPDRLKCSSKVMINSSRRSNTDFIVDYSILDKQHALILFNRSIGLVNMVNQ